MKKNYEWGSPPIGVLKKIMLMTKLTFFLILISVVCVNASVYSQSTKLSLNFDNATINEVLQVIESQTKFRFIYESNKLDMDKEVNLKVTDLEVEKILDKIFDDKEVSYTITESNLILIKPSGNDSTNKSFQQKKVSGKVVDSEGEPLPGVTVLVKGTTQGSVTDFNGTYSIDNITEDVTLLFSFVGMLTQEIEVGSQTIIDVTMQMDAIGIEEVVAVGYGVMKKSDLTGAVASVKSETLNKVAVSNPAETLQGRIAGVNVTNIGGAPGGGVKVTVRGVGTINNNSPLYIIDGVPGSFYMLNPDDIESVEVLKDGAAAAIYGTEAANGVILVTTKGGSEGKMKIEMHAKYGVQELANNVELTNAAEYIKVASMMYDNAGIARPEYLNNPVYFDTDWVGAVTRDAPQQEYNLNISGGNKTTNYYVSAGWLDQTGTLIGSDFQKASLRSNVDFKGDWLDGGFKLSYNETNSESIAFSIRETFHILPIIPIFDDSQPSGFGMADPETGMLSNNNPVGKAYYNENNYRDQYVALNTYLSIDLYEGLTYRLEAGYNNSNRRYHSSHPSYNVNAQEEVLYPGVYEEHTNWREWNLNNILTYNRTIDSHDFTIMAAYTTKKAKTDFFNAGIDGYKNVYNVVDGGLDVSEEPTGFLDEWFNTLNAGLDGETYVGGSRNTYTRASILGRLNYSYDNKYLAQVSIRRDGSSKFGSDSRYGVFPSVALGWRVSQEGFMADSELFSNLKLRGSYAKLGNEGSLGLYDFLPTISSSTKEFLSYSKGVGETVWLGSIARALENKELRWETTYATNIGVDFGMLNGSLNGSVNYYDNRTKDMLVAVPIPASSGLKTPVVNFGEVKNNGLEFELGYSGKANDFSYDVNATFSTTNNEVLKLGSDNASIYGQALNYTEHYPNQTRIGSPIGAFYLYQMDGIFQSEAEVDAHNAKGAEGEALQPNAEPGDIRFKDVNNDGVLNEDDVVYSGTGIPEYNYSLSLSASFRGFDASVLLYGAGGHHIYNGNRYYFESMRTPRNFYRETVNAWTEQNTNTDVPRAIFGDPNENSRASTRFLEKGDFLRLKNVQIGYTLPKELVSKVNLSKVRMYVSGQNLLTFTSYSGQDPEVGRTSVFNPSLDKTLYPISKLYLVGIQVGL